ncbi:MAG: transporter, partial [Jatrophihabitantaceae bacterium]|nr:transporter [Jatrophihabitantaceae bacterium]
LSQVSGSGRVDPAVSGGLALSLAAFAAFVLWERRARDPLLRLGLFKRLPFTMAVIAQFLNSLANFAVIVLVGLYFQAAKGQTPLEAGLAVLPLPAANAIASIAGPMLTRHLKARTVCVLGSSIGTAGLVLLLAATVSLSGFGPNAVALSLVGIGTGLFQPANIAAMLTGVPADELGATNALRLAIQNTANVLGTAVALMLLTSAVPAALRSAVVSGTVSDVGSAAVRDMRPGLALAFGVMAAMSALAIGASLAGRRVDDRAEAAEAERSAR